MDNIDIQALASFAKLNLTEKEKAFYVQSLKESLAKLCPLDKINNSKSVTQHNTVNFSSLRDDTVCQSADAEKIINMAKSKSLNYICVPKVINQEK